MELSSKSSKCFFLGLVVLVSILVSVRSTSVRTDNRAVVIDGKRRIIISGSIHYPRSTPEMWPDLIRKSKEGGLDTIETYVFWNGHEPRPHEYNFEGNYDIVRFFKEIQNAGLYAILRIGPYVCAEWDYGGLPAWLRDIPGMKFRLHNQPFEREMQNFTTLIVNKMKEANLFAKQGGPIILAQIENEYGNVMGGFKGDDVESATKYIQWCADMANSLKVDVPWIMCQQDQHTPSNVLNTCNGFYCHDWYPSRNIPKMWTENWTGWFKAWDKPDFHRPTEDLAFAVAHFFQNRGVLQNYYMYHGGTNFGRSTGGPYITTSYDYDAPLDEFGNIRQPKWGHLKQLHAVIKSIEKHLVYGNHSESRHGKITTTKYTLDGSSACFIGNGYENKDVNVTFEGSVYHVPAWSVSIMPDCTTVAYNSAKVKVQTSVMVKKPSIVEQEPEALQWSWMPEDLKPFLTDELGSFKSNHLLEQIVTAAGRSDYLWYRTSLDHDKEEKFTLFVNTTGHELYAFVNGVLVGFNHSPNWPFIFQLEAPVKLRAGKNYISLLSATVGTKNYGAYYELMPAGIVGGPVKLIRANGAAIDLSHSTWSYKTGLWGELKQIHLDRHGLKWQNGTLPIERPFTWYKTTFQAPVGSEGVVVDLLGLNKGMAWVNGNNLGRYWPTYIANDMGGCHRCDYRGPYVTWDNKEKCLTGCGEPAQRWYHVPRSFLKPGEPNTLVLFEEAGGDPSQVNFKTVAVGKVCLDAEKGDTIALSCENGRSISSIDFASFGLTRGKCGTYKGGCESKTAYNILSKACVGKESCTLKYNHIFTGKDCSCDDGSGSSVLTIQATC